MKLAILHTTSRVALAAGLLLGASSSALAQESGATPEVRLQNDVDLNRAQQQFEMQINEGRALQNDQKKQEEAAEAARRAREQAPAPATATETEAAPTPAIPPLPATSTPIAPTSPTAPP